MNKIQRFTKHERQPLLDKTCVCIGLILLIGITASGCGIRKTIKVEVSPKILQAKSVNFDQLLDLLDENADKIVSLSSSTMKASYTSGKIEGGILQAYRSAPGYLLIKRPGSIRINIQNPITKTSVADMLSVGDAFSIWSPTQNKFYSGKNSLKEIVASGDGENLSIFIRPTHILTAIMPSKIIRDGPCVHIALEEGQDDRARYYILSTYENSCGLKLFPTRKIWIERSELAVVRQDIYEAEGKLAETVQYGNITSVEGIRLPLSVRIERPADGYSLDLTFQNWKLNPDLGDDVFLMTPPDQAQRIELMEKRRSQTP
jgi:outer membrane lipoprotein-sorting protein